MDRTPAGNTFLASSAVTKHLFVTGGVASSLGKGLTASSLGSLLKARGLRVTMQKLDPYLNVDPGTMNPFQHGEVFVTEDGAETDLDIGHYERFLDTDLVGSANVTTGQVYSSVIAKERRGEYLGDTGSNMIGGLAGLWLVLTLGTLGQAIALALVLLITIYGEVRSISAWVERTPLVRDLDSWGRPGAHGRVPNA